MKILIQRVKQAQVRVDQALIADINQGLLAFIGIEQTDQIDQIQKAADKILKYRVFSDEQGKMNLSVKDIKGEVLCVSQFTLVADTAKGLRPGFSRAASPEQAEKVYTHFVNYIKAQYAGIQTGQFAADMQISLINDGPVTFHFDIT